MAKLFLQGLEVRGEDYELRERAALFNHAKKAVNHLSRHPSDRSALRSLVTCVKQLAEKLGDDEDEVIDNEDCDCDDPDNCDCEDEGADLQATASKSRKKHSVNSVINSMRYDANAVAREIARQRGQQPQGHRHDNRARRHPDPVVNALTEHRGNDAILDGIRNARARFAKKGR